MKNKYWTIPILLVFLMGCTAQRQPAPMVKNDRKFYTPSNWQQPIQSSKPARPVATAQKPDPAVPAAADTKKEHSGFKPDFTKRPVRRAAGMPPKQLSSNDGFQPKFTNATDSRQQRKDGAAANTSREQMIGYASWYGPGFHGKKTANGEKYNQNQMTAAHKILPMNTWVQVHNLENNRVVVVRINDRGPYKKNRIIDLTKKGAETLGFKDKGTARVSLKVLQYPRNYDPSKGLDPYKQVVVQIAVFRGKERAYNFRQQLSQRYQAIPFLIDDHKRKTYHVIAGPYEERKQALKIAKALKADGIDNFVRSYRK